MSLLFISEHKGRFFSRAIERRGYITLEPQSSPDYWAIHGWTNTLKKLRLESDIAFFGNSITAGSDFQPFFPDKKIINLGYPGDDIRGMIRRVPMLSATNPKKVFLMAGTNDLVHINLEEYITRYTQLVKTIKKSIPNVNVYIESVLPSNHTLGNYARNTKVQQANIELKNISQSLGCTFIDLYSLYVDNKNELAVEFTKDGVHLLPSCYGIWAENIKQYIYE